MRTTTFCSLGVMVSAPSTISKVTSLKLGLPFSKSSADSSILYVPGFVPLTDAVPLNVKSASVYILLLTDQI